MMSECLPKYSSCTKLRKLHDDDVRILTLYAPSFLTSQRLNQTLQNQLIAENVFAAARSFLVAKSWMRHSSETQYNSFCCHLCHKRKQNLVSHVNRQKYIEVNVITDGKH